MKTADASAVVSKPRHHESVNPPEEPLSRKIPILALPILGEQLFTLVVGLVQTFLAGTLSKEATAAVGTATYMGWLLSLVFALVSSGVLALISRSIGARDRAMANHVLAQAMLLGVVFGGLVTGAGILLSSTLAEFLLAAPAARILASEYLSVSALGYVMVGTTIVGKAALRASGDTKTPLLITVVVNVLSLGLSTTAVFGMSSGALGIAFSEVVAQTLGAALTVVLLARGRLTLRLHALALRPDPPVLVRLMRIGVPAAIDGAIMATAQLYFIRIIGLTAVDDLSTATYAAHQIAVRVETITYASAFSWGIASATLVGQYLGAHRFHDATRAGHVGAAQGIYISLVIGLGFLLFAEPIYGLMTNDPTVRNVGVPALRLLALVQPFVAASQIYLSCLKGAGDTRWPMIYTMICGVGIRLPLAYVGGVVLQGGLIGAWSGMWADHITRALLACGRYVHGGWRSVNV